jgi:hypothetical protein
MKKFLAIFALLLLICTPLFAAAATITTTEYGYSCTGGTDATSVTTTDAIVKTIVFFPNTSTDKAVITTGSANVSFATMTNGNEVITFGDNGVRMSNIKVTLTASTDILVIATR